LIKFPELEENSKIVDDEKRKELGGQEFYEMKMVAN
jgi:hypothetical protein